MDPIWKNNSTSVKARLQVYTQVVRAKLVYGLETCRLTQAGKTKLDTFQLRGLRKILGVKHVYYDRSMKNDKVYEMASLEREWRPPKSPM